MQTTQSFFEQSRYNMVEQQVRPAGVLNDDVLNALLTLSREDFVSPDYKNMAYSDTELPITIDGKKTNAQMLPPRLEARFAQELLLKPTDSVLEIGTGTGYQAAVLSHLCKEVTTVDINPDMVALAKQNLSHANISNVTVEQGDALQGWGDKDYDAILLSGSVPELHDDLKYQLMIGGHLIAVVGQYPMMEVVRVTRTAATEFTTQTLFETCIAPLQGAVASHFKF